MTFPILPDRKLTYSFKWEKYRGKDVLPMWVADTEFKCAPAILDAITQRVEHGVLGYTLPAQYTPANDAVISWCQHQYEWSIESDWIVWMPGVVPAFNVACDAFARQTGKGRILIQEPNYPPLRAAPGLNECERIVIDTITENGRWTLDFEQLEREAAHPNTHLMILCNPMNPVGSVFSQTELDRVADICERHDVLLCSDEIHCDLILEQNTKHLPASAHAKLAERSITLMAASKTFNIAGLGAAFAIIPDKKLRQQFNRAAAGTIPWVTIVGLVATEAAFTQCDQWRAQQLDYLRDNRDMVVERINKIPGLSLISPQATYLAWIDASGLEVDNVVSWCEAKGVGPSPGADFGSPSFFRINYGCGRDMLNEVLTRLEN